MRKLFLGAGIILAVIAITFFGCSKEEALINSEKKEIPLNTEYSLPTKLKSDIEIVNGLMKFKNRESFTQATYLLEEEDLKWNQQFYEQWKDINEEERNEKIDENYFNPFLIMETFEYYHSFNSLRKHLKEKEDEWLNNEILDFENNPSNHPVGNIFIQTVVNENGEYMIGNSIYKVENDGVVFEITDGDFNTLYLIEDGEYKPGGKSFENVIAHNIEMRSTYREVKSDCKAYRRNTDYWWFGKTKYLYMIIDLDWDGWGSAAKAKIKAYKKKRGKWKRWYTGMGVQSTIWDYDINCNSQGVCLSGKKYRNSASSVSVHCYKLGMGYRIKIGDGGGIFYKNGYDNKVLYWE